MKCPSGWARPSTTCIRSARRWLGTDNPGEDEAVSTRTAPTSAESACAGGRHGIRSQLTSRRRHAVADLIPRRKYLFTEALLGGASLMLAMEAVSSVALSHEPGWLDELVDEETGERR